jgi:hypothetical protein
VPNSLHCIGNQSEKFLLHLRDELLNFGKLHNPSNGFAKEIVQGAGANSEERFNRVVLGEVSFREQAKAYLREAVTRNRKPIRDTTSIEGAFRKWIFPEIGDLPLALVDNLA